jgi:glycosyltransferase involved in cell wall biosynthesis
VFVLPSYREGFPIAPLEAQACGLPLITTTATGCIDSQPPENSMLLIRPREHKEISALLMLLIANPKLRATAGSRARKWVVDNFHSKDVIQNQNNFLKNLLN